MRTINLASGSDGNSTYIEGSKTKILVDDGLSCSETILRLERAGINPKELNAIVISHIHSDHIKGVDIFAKKFDLPVYAHEDVWAELDDKLKKVPLEKRKFFDGSFAIGELIVDPVEVPHDVKCYGFSFTDDDKKVSILTDLGHLNDKILSSVKGSALVYLEANYDKEMLMKGTKYPLSLKMRIAGPNGHLSNDSSSKAVEFLASSGTRQIVLSHLSRENNTPTLAYNYICEKIKENGVVEGEDIRIDVASPNIGSIFRIK